MTEQPGATSHRLRALGRRVLRPAADNVAESVEDRLRSDVDSVKGSLEDLRLSLAEVGDAVHELRRVLGDQAQAALERSEITGRLLDRLSAQEEALAIQVEALHRHLERAGETT